MGVDFGAALFYGFELVTDHESPNYDMDRDTSELSDDLFMSKVCPIGIYSVSTGWNEWYITINKTYQSTYNGSAIEVKVIPDDSENWNQALKDFCLEYGYVYSEPTWILVSTLS